jgi:glyoxylase-like metal-dependent hydrolase (beta-lactamase superfamily II)
VSTASAQAKPAALQPAIFSFKLGGFAVANILDSRAARHGLTAMYGDSSSADAVKALARANHIDAERFEHTFIPTVVDTGKQLILFDTGNGTLRQEFEPLRDRLPDGHLVDRLRELGYAPEDVDVVVITHGHPDHIGALSKRGQPVFAKARYVFAAAEYDFWQRGENVREARKFNRELFVTIATPLAERASFIKPGDDIAPGIRAVDAAGHSPGMTAYHVESEGKRLLIWADTCTHYVVALQRPDLAFSMDDDKEKATATRQRILDMAATDELFVAGFHMPFPGIGLVQRAQGGGYRWLPHSYQLNL